MPEVDLPQFTFGNYLPGIANLPLTNLLWWIFVGLSVTLLFISVVLFYHWMRYGYPNKGVIFAQILFILVTITGIIVMLGSISYLGQ